MKSLVQFVILLLWPAIAFSQTVHIGDILCTDGSIVSSEAFAASGRTAEGVVFYVDATKQHGWAVGLKDLGEYSWGPNSKDTPLRNCSSRQQALNDLDGSESDYDVIISHNDYENEYKKDVLFLIPQIITAGIGCRKDISFEIIERNVLNALEKEKCHILALNSIASIDKKANEKGILEFAKKYDLPFNTYSAEELNSLEGDFTKSEFVKSVVQVDNVCERSAIIESYHYNMKL